MYADIQLELLTLNHAEIYIIILLIALNCGLKLATNDTTNPLCYQALICWGAPSITYKRTSGTYEPRYRITCKSSRATVSVYWSSVTSHVYHYCFRITAAETI
jgi:hypothetical protein